MRTSVAVTCFVCAIVVSSGVSATAASMITSAQIKDGTIQGVDVANNTLAGVKIKDGSVQGVDLANNAVTGAKIKDGSVGIADLAANARPSGVGLTRFTYVLAYSSLGSRFATCPQGTSDSGALIDAYYASSGRALDFKVCMVE